MLKESIFANMNGNWIKWSDYCIEKGYILPAPGASMTMYDAVKERHDMLCEAINCGRMLAQNSDNAEEICLLFARRYGLIGWMTALPCDISFYNEPHTYLRYAGFVSSGKIVDTKQYIACFFPRGTEKAQAAVAQLAGRTGIYNKVFSSDYGEPLSWTVSLFLMLYEHFCYAEQIQKEDLPEHEKKKMRRHLEMEEEIGICFHMEQKNVLRTLFLPDSLRSILLLTYAFDKAADEDSLTALKRCKHCGKIYYNANARSEFCSVKCRNHFNIIAFRERNRK